MTIQPYTPPTEAAPTVTDYQSRAVVRLGEWAHAADAAYAVAQRLVQSSFVPVAFRGKPIELAGFTRDNVAALTQAAGADERYDHGHVFD